MNHSANRPTSPLDKALWFIEAHFNEELALEDVARVAGMSRYHLTRAFGMTTGYPIMRYARGRRLTEAARSLAKGAPDILALALDTGYGSHEAFTRAFRDQFQVTPESVRAQRHLDNLKLVEPIMMNETPLAHLDPPRIENGKALLLAGLSARHTHESSAGMPAQWQRFIPHIGNLPGQVGKATYGVVYNGDEGGADYMCAVEVADFSQTPSELSRLRVPAHKYAVFAHRDHVSTVRRTWYTIWNKALPEAGLQIADAPEFERYDEKFDPRTGEGGFEIWIPIKN
jgi:AraC family transcriptional regulator